MGIAEIKGRFRSDFVMAIKKKRLLTTAVLYSRNKAYRSILTLNNYKLVRRIQHNKEHLNISYTRPKIVISAGTQFVPLKKLK
jgi:hypothetical protein